jgi:hypothetical protein
MPLRISVRNDPTTPFASLPWCLGKKMDDVIVYGLSSDRSRQFVERFLQHFGSRRTRCQDEYEYPQFADPPDCVYTSDELLFDRLASETNVPYQLYWNVTSAHARLQVRQAIVGYTNDGCVIVGIPVPEQSARAALNEMQQALQVRWAMMTGDECPPDSASRFQELCRAAELPRILGGKLHA